MSTPQTTIPNLSGLVVFTGGKGQGVLSAGGLIAGQRLTSIRILSSSAGAGPGAGAVAQGAVGADASGSFSSYVIEGGMVVQTDSSDLSHSTYIALATGP